MEHPAKFSDNILDKIRQMLDEASGLLLDPFAGTGKVHQLQTPNLKTIGVELEPEWANMHPNTIVGNALHLPFADQTFDYIVTSPVYGNRMSDHHNAKDGSKRQTYKHTIGRDLHPDNSGQLQWGPRYKQFHEQAWREIKRVTKIGGTLILNTSNHIRKGQEQPVTQWHQNYFETHGWNIEDSTDLTTSRYRRGANHNLRPSTETLSQLVRVT